MEQQEQATAVEETPVETERGPAEEDLLAAVGAVIFASGEPVRAADIAAAFGRNVNRKQVEAAIDALESRYTNNREGIRLERIAGGVRLATRPEVAEWVRRFVRQQNRTRLSPAALETLAIIAYKQPVTAPEIQAIRGKDPAGALRNLIDKKLLRILGKKKVIGTPFLYGTTKQFLVHFGLESLSDLPSMEEFDAFVDAFQAQGGEVVDESEIEPVDEVETPDDLLPIEDVETDEVEASEDVEPETPGDQPDPVS